MKRLQRIVILLFGLLLVASAHATQRNLMVKAINAQAQKRVALVIGNAAYQGAPVLRNPVNDAKAISDALNGLGFDVIEVTDASQKEMNRAITSFGSKLNDETAALFFYAGHGLQVRGKNYIIPVDAQIEAEAAVSTEAVSVDAVLEQLNASPVSIVILDACRNNPFERSFRKMGGGLAQMEAPKGSFIAYATAPGKTAADGDDKHGLFTQELLKQITEPGVELAKLFMRVRANVAAKSGDAQMPWDSSSMVGEFYFKPVQIASLEPVPAPVGGSVSLDDLQKQQETRAQWDKWQAGMKVDFDKVAALNAAPDIQITAWERFLANYTQDNPYSVESKRLRVQAQSMKQAAQAQQQAAAQLVNQEKETAIYKSVDADGNVIFSSTPSRGAKKLVLSNELSPVMIRIPNRNYEIGKYDVTQGEWKAVMGSNPSLYSSCGDDCPVDSVSWNDAQEFIQKLNSQTGEQYRLPTEAEWEYACYGGSQTKYCGGDSFDAVGWYVGNSRDQTHPVGQKQANGYGLYDMSGNVWQWMQDWYDSSQHGRVQRGGSIGSMTQNKFPIIDRIFNEPTYRYSNIGFRLARTIIGDTKSNTGQQNSVSDTQRKGALAENSDLMSIESSEVYVDPSGKNFNLSALIKNHALYPQAYPNFDLTLSDEKNKIIGRHNITPSDYLKAGEEKLGMAANSEMNMNVRFELPNKNTSGYRLFLHYGISPSISTK